MWWSGDCHVTETGSDFAKLVPPYPFNLFFPYLLMNFDTLHCHVAVILCCRYKRRPPTALWCKGLSLGFHSPRPGHNLLLVFCPEEEYTFNTLRWPRDGELCIVRMFTCLLFHHATASIRANLQKNTPNSQIADLGLQASGRRFPPEIR